MAERITIINSNEDYYPFGDVETLKWPNYFSLDEYSRYANPQMVAQNRFRLEGVLGIFYAYPLMPKEGQQTPLGETRFVQAIRDGTISVIETPLSLAVLMEIRPEDATHYRKIYRTKAIVTIGTASYALRCINNQLYELDEEIPGNGMNLISDQLRDTNNRDIFVVVPGRIEEIRSVKVNFIG